jgi:hypothetical protein
MKTVKVIYTFTDAEEGVLRNIGDSFSVRDERADKLEQGGFVEIVEAAKKPSKKTKKE